MAVVVLTLFTLAMDIYSRLLRMVETVALRVSGAAVKEAEAAMAEMHEALVPKQAAVVMDVSVASLTVAWDGAATAVMLIRPLESQLEAMEARAALNLGECLILTSRAILEEEAMAGMPFPNLEERTEVTEATVVTGSGIQQVQVVGAVTLSPRQETPLEVTVVKVVESSLGQQLVVA